MMNLLVLLIVTMLSARSIEVVSAVNTEASFGWHFPVIMLLRAASHLVLLLSTEISVLILEY